MPLLSAADACGRSGHVYDYVNAMDRYDEESDSWSFVAPFPLKREYLAVAVL